MSRELVSAPIAAPPSPPISAPLPAEPVTEPMMAPVPAPSSPPDNARSDCVVPQAETDTLNMSADISIFVLLKYTRAMEVASDGAATSKTAQGRESSQRAIIQARQGGVIQT